MAWEKFLACTRRDFLRTTGTAVLTLGLSNLELACKRSEVAETTQPGGQPAAEPAAPSQHSPAALPDYRTWEDVYRQQWAWERVVRGTHTMTNCTSGCAWNLYVKDNMVWREEQQSPYSASRPGLPDFNPRGCQKGGCATNLMYSPSRIRYPLKRAGRRGEGAWKRISWDEAINEIAAAIVDAIEQDGPASIVCEQGPNIGAGPNTAAGMRFMRLLGSPTTDSMAQIGDLSTGATITLGNGHPCGSSDDWWRSSYLVLWSFNPVSTRIPDAHFITEARYRGAQVVTISPDYNNSAFHADLWINPRPGTDAALALGAAQVIIAEKLYNAAYVTEQSDLPLLVRTDTKRFLRESDLKRGGSDSTFLVWHATKKSPAPAPGSGNITTLNGNDPPAVLDYEGKISIGGKEVGVRTVFSLLKEHLDRDYSPAQVAKITGVSEEVIRGFARGFAAAPAALILSQWGQCKFLHGDLIQRAQILLASLTGNLGRAGGGWRAGGFFAPEGFALLGMQAGLGLWNIVPFAAKAFLDPSEVEKTFSRYFVPGTIWHAVHGELEEISGARQHGDSFAPRPAKDYLREAIEKKWFPIYPAPGKPPRVLLSIFGSILRHCRNNARLLETLWPKVRLVVDINFRMSETGRHADMVLPAAFWYEKVDLKYLVSFIPYVHLGDRAVPPLDEAKPEWEIFALLAEAVAREARRRQMQPYKDIAGEDRDAKKIDEAFTDGGRFGPTAEEQALEFVLGYSSQTKGFTLTDMRREGAVRFEGTGPPTSTVGYYSDYAKDEPLVPHRWFAEKKQRWPTLHGRQQFYVDHPWFIECGETLPVYKSPPPAGGNYPLVLSGGHTRWSIHAQWRDQPSLLRLQRGEPVVYINERDAAARGIHDHDLVRVRNDLGAFVIRAKIGRYVQPGEVVLYHAWEPYQFRSGFSDHGITPSPFKPTSLAGDYGQLHWAYAHWEPNQIDRDTRVDVERV